MIIFAIPRVGIYRPGEATHDSLDHTKSHRHKASQAPGALLIYVLDNIDIYIYNVQYTYQIKNMFSKSFTKPLDKEFIVHSLPLKGLDSW